MGQFVFQEAGMGPDRCTHCGGVIDDGMVEFRGMSFCSDECCEEHAQSLSENEEPSVKELSEEEIEGLNLEEVEFEDDSEMEDDLDDDLDDFLQADF
jgi:hypothetical protein